MTLLSQAERDSGFRDVPLWRDGTWQVGIVCLPDNGNPPTFFVLSTSPEHENTLEEALSVAHIVNGTVTFCGRESTHEVYIITDENVSYLYVP